MTKTTIGIIGTGVVGERIINQALSNEQYEIAAIFDTNAQRTKELQEKYINNLRLRLVVRLFFLHLMH